MVKEIALDMKNNKATEVLLCSGIPGCRLWGWLLYSYRLTPIQAWFIEGMRTVDDVSIIKTSMGKYLRAKRG